MKIIKLIFIAIFTSVLTISIAYSDGHIKIKHFATAKLYLTSIMPTGDREPIVTVDPKGSYIETADGAKWAALEPCADWLYIQASGVFNLDVRCTAQTDDGAFVKINYKGRAYPLNDAAAEKFGAGELMKSEDMYFYTAVTMTTMSEKYSWINNTLFVGEMAELQFFNDKGERPYVVYKWYQMQ